MIEYWQIAAGCIGILTFWTGSFILAVHLYGKK